MCWRLSARYLWGIRIGHFCENKKGHCSKTMALLKSYLNFIALERQKVDSFNNGLTLLAQ